MAIFPRKNPLPVQIPLLNEVASRTLDWSRAVRVAKMEEAYKKTNKGVFENASGTDAKYSNRFRLLVPGAIYTHQKTNGDTDIAIVVCNTTGDRLYTAVGASGGEDVFKGMITPIIKANALVVATKSSNGTGADFKNFYMVFVPTLSSVGITGLSNFLVHVDIFAPLISISDKSASRYAVPSDLML